MIARSVRPPRSAGSRDRARTALPLLLGALLLVLAGGCARPPLPDYGSASRTWSVFNAHFRNRPEAPAFAVSTSLAWSSGKKSARILIDLWGDFAHAAPGAGADAAPEANSALAAVIAGAPAGITFESPGGEAAQDAPDRTALIRMDAWSNLGGSLCNLREGPDGLAALYPDQLKAYTHADPVIGARLLGLPFPFSLTDFAALLYGDFSDLVPAKYDGVEALPGGGYRYTFRSGRVRTLSLDRAARPLRMTGMTSVPEQYREKLGGEWSIDFSNYPAAPAPVSFPEPGGAEGANATRPDASGTDASGTDASRPDASKTDASGTDAAQPSAERAPMAERLFLTLPGENRGSLRIQSRELKLHNWPAKAMTLNLPEGVVPRALDGAPRDWTTGRPEGEEPPQPAAKP